MCLLTVAVYLKGYQDFQQHKGVSAGLYKYLLKATVIVTFFFPLTPQIWSHSIVVRYEHNIYIKFNMSYRMLKTAWTKKQNACKYKHWNTFIHECLKHRMLQLHLIYKIAFIEM